MNHAEETPHIRSLFQQFKNDDAKKIKLVLKLRDEALKYLPASAIAKVPPPYFSDEARAAYFILGQNLDWNLSILGDSGVYAFCSAARGAGLTPSQQSAAALLYACTKAIEKNTVSEHVQQNIHDAYAGLDTDDVARGAVYSATQSRRAQKPRGKGDDRRTMGDLIQSLHRHHPNEKPSELWPHLRTLIEEWAGTCTERAIGNRTDYLYSRCERMKTISFKQFGERLRQIKNTV